MTSVLLNVLYSAIPFRPCPPPTQNTANSNTDWVNREKLSTHPVRAMHTGRLSKKNNKKKKTE